VKVPIRKQSRFPVNLPCYNFVVTAEATMVTPIRRLGNSRGVIIPKLMLKEAGLEKEAEIVLERGAIVLRKPCRNPRQGWAEASRKLAEAGEDKLVWPEFGNQSDGELLW
jgi:antitoxin MazE